MSHLSNAPAIGVILSSSPIINAVNGIRPLRAAQPQVDNFLQRFKEAISENPWPPRPEPEGQTRRGWVISKRSVQQRLFSVEGKKIGKVGFDSLAILGTASRRAVFSSWGALRDEV